MVKNSSPKPGLRMKEIVAASGLPKSTILYYLNQGLLTTPVKTSPNMAYYSPECVEELIFIKTMQSKHRLPLQKIKLLIDLKQQGHNPEPVAELLKHVFNTQNEKPLNLKEYCNATGLPLDVVQVLLDAELLIPTEEGVFDQQDVLIGLLFFKAYENGLNYEDIHFYPALGKKIVEHEMALRNRMVKDLPIDENVKISMDALQFGRAFRGYIIDRLFQRNILYDTENKGFMP
jgi:DNA-binding transcriptional MerR regulator